MNIAEFCTLLDPHNVWSESLAHATTFLYDRDKLTVIERKGSDLVEVVQHLVERRLHPIIDKKLKLVFGVTSGSHMLLRAELFRYYYYERDPELNLPGVGSYESADRYISEGHGYFISSQRENTIVIGIPYRPDSFDKDLFLTYELDRI
ncbi:MAG: hypothetical protein Q8P17_02220 [bacterium]|nr:hypothetical protein [bacterium]